MLGGTFPPESARPQDVKPFGYRNYKDMVRTHRERGHFAEQHYTRGGYLVSGLFCFYRPWVGSLDVFIDAFFSPK